MYHSGEEMKPTDFGDIFSTEWTAQAIAEVVNKGIGHLTQVCSVARSRLHFSFVAIESLALG